MLDMEQNFGFFYAIYFFLINRNTHLICHVSDKSTNVFKLLNWVSEIDNFFGDIIIHWYANYECILIIYNDTQCAALLNLRMLIPLEAQKPAGDS